MRLFHDIEVVSVVRVTRRAPAHKSGSNGLGIWRCNPLVIHIDTCRVMTNVNGGMALIFAGRIKRRDDSSRQDIVVIFDSGTLFPTASGRKRRANRLHVRAALAA